MKKQKRCKQQKKLPLEKGVGGIAKGADDVVSDKFVADPSHAPQLHLTFY